MCRTDLLAGLEALVGIVLEVTRRQPHFASVAAVSCRARMHEEAGGITAVGATSAALHLRAHGVRHLFCGGEVGGTRSAPCSPLCAARSGCGGKVTWSVAQAGLCLGWSGRAMRGFAGQKARRWRAASRLGVHAAAAAPVRWLRFPGWLASVFPTLPRDTGPRAKEKTHL